MNFRQTVKSEQMLILMAVFFLNYFTDDCVNIFRASQNQRKSLDFLKCNFDCGVSANSTNFKIRKGVVVIRSRDTLKV